MTLPSLGYAEQVSEARGITTTLKVFESFMCNYQLHRTIGAIRLKGFVPSFVNGGRNRLTVSLDGEEVTTSEVEGGFELVIGGPDLSADLSPGKTISLRVDAEHYVSPHEAGIAAGKRPVAFLYQRIEFE